MKNLVLAAAFSAVLPQLHAQELSDADRETLLDRLEKIQESVNSTTDSRFRNAITAYRAAMLSDEAAIDFYLKCEEKVNFEDLKKDGGDFRDWKRKNDAKLSDKDFKLALRQQLRWLLLTLEAASDDADREALATKAAEALDSILSQAEDLKRHKEVLNGSVTGTVFAKAYDLNTLKVENWPLSPIPIQPVYDQVIFPPLRRADRTESLRTAWTKRISQEMILLDQWSGKPGEKLKTGEHSPQYEKFVADGLPKMQWESEVDIFKAGDERGSAVRMLAHIEKYILHESAPNWADQFVALLHNDLSPEDVLKSAPES